MQAIEWQNSSNMSIINYLFTSFVTREQLCFNNWEDLTTQYYNKVP